MDFFRKYQRPILLVAAVFALVTFSITGDMLSTVEGLFRKKLPAASIQVGDREVELTSEDYQVARALSAPTLVTVMPPLPSIDPSESQNPSERIAVLRRAAIENGIEASYDEVDAAIDAVAATRDLEPRDLARGFASLDQFRATIYEGLRIGTLVRLNALPFEPFDHELADSLAHDEDLVKVRYLKIDKKAIEDAVGAELDAEEDPEAALRTWARPVDRRHGRGRSAGVRVPGPEPDASAGFRAGHGGVRCRRLGDRTRGRRDHGPRGRTVLRPRAAS